MEQVNYAAENLLQLYTEADSRRLAIVVLPMISRTLLLVCNIYHCDPFVIPLECLMDSMPQKFIWIGSV